MKSISWFLSPVFYILWPAAFLLNYNFHGIELSWTLFLIPLALVTAVSIFLVIVSFITSDRKKYSLTLSFVIFWFFCYQPLHGIMYRANERFLGLEYGGAIPDIQNNLVVWLYYGVMIVGILFLTTRKSISRVAVNSIATIGGILLFTSVISIAIKATQSDSSIPSFDDDFLIASQDRDTLKVTAGPPIYYIVPDMYDGLLALEKIYQYDNSEFYDWLESKGFYVAYESRTNYAYSDPSSASTLNFTYLDSLYSTELRGDSWGKALDLIRESRIEQVMNKLGYQYFMMGYYGQGFQREVDRRRLEQYGFSCPRGSSDYLKLLVGLTPIAPYWNFEHKRARQNILCSFDQLHKLPALLPQPSFVWSRIMAPHQPWYFDKYGNPLPDDVATDYSIENRDKLYLDYLIFTTEKLKQAITTILDNSDPLPVIILQTDHGNGGWPPEGMICNEVNVLERMGILSAYYFPDKDYSLLYPTISPVNSFRVLLNKYFEQDLPLLPDKAYFSDVSRSPWKFIDVTDNLENCAE